MDGHPDGESNFSQGKRLSATRIQSTRQNVKTQLCYNLQMREVAKTYLSYNEQQALDAIVRNIPSAYPVINKIVLYGSKIRGDFLVDSDIDILFVADYNLARSVKFEIYDMIFECEIEHGLVVSVVFVSSDDFEKHDITLMKQVHKEGIIIWSKE